MDEYENEEGGITLGYIFRMIFSQKWLALILTAAITLVGTLGIYFVYARPKQVYTVTFSVTSTDTTSQTLFSYDDGTYFYIDNYINFEVLDAVRKSDSSFKNINIEEIVKKDVAKYDDVYKTLGQDKLDSDSKLPLVRKIKLEFPAKYFESGEQARSFLSKLVYYPVEKYSSIVVDYNLNLDNDDFEKALSFEDQLSYISDQIKMLQNGYEKLPSIAEEDGTLIAKYANKFNRWVDRLDIDNLRYEASAYHYVKDYEKWIERLLNQLNADDGLINQLKDKNRELTENQAIFDAAVGQSSGTGTVELNAIVSKLSQLREDVITLERQITNIRSYIGSYYDIDETQPLEKEVVFLLDGSGKRAINQEQIEATTEYANKIETIFYQLLDGDGEGADKINYIDQYTELNKVLSVKNANKVIRSVQYASGGGWSIVICLAISLIVGLVVAMIAAYTVGWNNERKRALAGVAPQAGSVAFGEAQLQAAATKDEEEKKE